MRWRYLTVTVASLAALTACGGSEPDAAPDVPAGGSKATTEPTAPAPVDPVANGPTTPTNEPEDVSSPEVSCPIQGWNTEPDKSAELTYTEAQILNVRIGKQDCFDRVVIDINNGPEVGFYASYEPVVRQDGSGEPIEVAGGAALQLIVGAPATMLADPGFTLYPASVLEANDWQALREVRYAGFFEGQSTFAIGVAQERPFAVSTVVREGQVTHVIVDIAH